MTQQISLRNQFFFIALLIFLGLGQLQKFSLGPGVSIYGHDVVICGWLLSSALIWLKNTLNKNTTSSAQENQNHAGAVTIDPAIVNTYLNSPSVWLLIWLSVTTLISAVQSDTFLPMLFLARVLTYLTLLIWLAKKNPLPHTWLRYGALALGLSWFVLGVLQLSLLPDLRFLKWLGYDDHYYRLASTFLDPNFAGIALVLTLLLFLNTATLGQLKRVGAAVVPALAAGIAATYSRASYLSILAVIPLFLLLTNSKHRQRLATLLATGFVIAVFTWFFLPKPGGEGVDLLRTASISARASSTTLYLSSLAGSEWLFGRGLYSDAPITTQLEGIPVTNNARVPDNFFVLLLISSGLPGLLLGIATCIEWLWKLWQYKHTAPALLCALLIHAQFNNSVLEPFIFLFFGISVVSLYLEHVQLRHLRRAS